VETAPLTVPPKLRAVSDVLLADSAPRRTEKAESQAPASGSDTRPSQPIGNQTLPPSGKTLPPGKSADIVAFLAGLPAHAPKEKTGITGITSGGTGIFTAGSSNRAGAGPSPRPVEAFRLLQRNLMEIALAGKVFVKQGTIYSYTGNLTFWVKEKRPAATPALVIVTGNGKVLLTDRDREINISAVEGALCVQPTSLLACEESVTPRYIRLGDGDSGPEFVSLEGHGLVALSVATRPLTLAITPDQPVAVAAASVIMWAGVLVPQLVQDQALSEALLAPGAPAATLVRLEGTGRVLMEQTP
jgi:uncharacterized protein (AIM24 family)